MKTVHLSDTLHKQLKTLASKEGVTLNVYINKLLWQAVGGVKL